MARMRSLICVFGIFVLCNIQSSTCKTTIIRNGAISHSTYTTHSKISLEPNTKSTKTNAVPQIIARLDRTSTQNPTLPPSVSTYQTKTNKATDPKSANAMRDYKPHTWSENHNYGLDGDVLSEEQAGDVYVRNDNQWKFQSNAGKIGLWVAVIFIALCGVFIMCTCLCVMK